MNIDYNKILSGSYAWVGFVSISKLRSHGNKIVLVKQSFMSLKLKLYRSVRKLPTFDLLFIVNLDYLMFR